MENLQIEIEKRVQALVFDVVRMVRESTKAAIDMAFVETQCQQKIKGALSISKVRSDLSRSGNHRTREEIAELSERLYRLICELPGSRMEVFAKKMGMKTSALYIPARRLIEADRVRKAGERNETTYFPIGSSKSPS